MSERRLTLLNGGPGTDTARIGFELESQSSRSIEFISINHIIRRIGNRALISSYEDDVTNHLQTSPDKPLNSELAYDLTYEAMKKADMRHHVLLEGFPSSPDQINNLYELASVTQRKLTGMIETTAPDAVALERIVEQELHPSIEQAQKQLRAFQNTFPEVRTALYRNMNIYTIDTDGDKDVTDHMAMTALHELMDQEVDLSRAA